MGGYSFQSDFQNGRACPVAVVLFFYVSDNGLLCRSLLGRLSPMASIADAMVIGGIHPPAGSGTRMAVVIHLMELARHSISGLWHVLRLL